MSIKSIFFSKSVLDFTYMFCSNIIKKGFGFVREVILASIFGSSILYSNFLLLRTVSDLFSELSQGSALQASLLSKFSKLYSTDDDVCLIKTFKFSQKIMASLFILSQLIQIPIVFYIASDYFWTFILLSLLLGVILSVNFYNAIFLVVMQGKGQFKKHSICTTIDIFISTLVLYPFSILFGVIGIAISRLLGLLSLFYFYLFPMLSEQKGRDVEFGIKDFNISLLFLGNFANIIILLSRFIAGLDDNSNNIAFFNYSVVLLNVLLTAVILNLNTIVLRRLSIKKDIQLIFFSGFSALLLGLGLVFVINVYGFEIIQFIFQRGAFTLDDTIATLAYAKDLSYSFVLIFLASALFQPFFTLPQDYLKIESKNLAIPFLISIGLIIVYFQFYPNNAKIQSLIMMYSLSVVYFIVSLYSYIKYYRHVS
jgi:peptidoglycan biosynthesis protein MviN/MurJ (putative lipid II flippase)